MPCPPLNPPGKAHACAIPGRASATSLGSVGAFAFPWTPLLDVGTHMFTEELALISQELHIPAFTHPRVLTLTFNIHYNLSLPVASSPFLFARRLLPLFLLFTSVKSPSHSSGKGMHPQQTPRNTQPKGKASGRRGIPSMFISG